MTAISPPPERPATVHDVARHAGVSAQTVSRLLKGVTVRPVTAKRVQDAITDLNYRPNLAARTLRTRRSSIIGAVAHEMFEYGPSRLLRGAALAAREAGYSLNVVGVNGTDRDAIESVLEIFQAQRVAGVLAITLTDEIREAVAGRASDIPVLIDPVEAAGGPSTMNEAGAALVAAHLIASGHRHIGIVEGPSTWLPARQRTHGFRAAVERAGGRCTTIGEGDWSAISGERAALAFAMDSGVSAVFCANDAMAFGFIAGLRSRNIDVPAHVSVVGFDDVPESRFFYPALTSLRPDYEAQGRLAFSTLLTVVEGTAAERLDTPPPLLLVERDSVRQAPPPSPDPLIDPARPMETP